jgi:hypothetical protein
MRIEETSAGIGPFRRTTYRFSEVSPTEAWKLLRELQRLRMPVMGEVFVYINSILCNFTSSDQLRTFLAGLYIANRIQGLPEEPEWWARSRPPG